MHTPKSLFRQFYETLSLPVIVCLKQAGSPVVYMNAASRLLLAPSMSIRVLKGNATLGDLRNFLYFNRSVDFTIFMDGVMKSGMVENFRSSILTYEKEPLTVTVSANGIRLDDKEYVVIYLAESDIEVFREEGITEQLLTRILHEAYHEADVDKTIQSILALAGRYSKVSRVYIFEDIAPDMTRNTYEWCADGVEPAIQDLQNLKKSDYNYDVIMSTSMYIYNDTRQLPQSDREILLDMQGIKSIAILALFHQAKPLGYIGFDDTVNYREWTRREIQILEGIASVVSSLISRRNAEREIAHSHQVMQTITDNLEDLIYVSDLKTYELIFVSKSLAASLGMTIEELKGKKCWEALHYDQAGPCPFCPISNLYREDGSFLKESCIWEFQNDINGKWYLIKDNIITWIDGHPAHLETAVDITYRKQYEEQLKISASTDAMTDVYNREWGYAKLKEIMNGEEEVRFADNTLAFIDIDNLKKVNDTLGHKLGDELIINTIKNISASIGGDEFICRWGGDEFLLILRRGLPAARKVMEKIELAIERFNKSAGKPYTISISHGLVPFKQGAGYDVDEIITEADKMMYAQKRWKKTGRAGTTHVIRPRDRDSD